jgi:hypothetical protein
VVCQLLFIKQSVGGYYNQITWLAFASSGAVEADFSGSFGPGYSIGVKPLPVGEIVHTNLLMLSDICLNHEVSIDAQTAFIVQTRSRNTRPMNFGFQKNALHNLISSRVYEILPSISVNLDTVTRHGKSLQDGCPEGLTPFRIWLRCRPALASA